MRRARRLASAVVAASLAVAGLSACRSQPAVAAYIGDGTRITEQRVQEIWDEAREGLADNQASAGAAAERAGGSAAPTEPGRMPITRADIVRTLVSLDVFKRAAAEKNIQLPTDLAYEQVATQLRLPADSEFVRLYTQANALQILLGRSLTSTAELTEADLRDVYRRLAENGAMDEGMTFEQFRTSVPQQAQEQLKAAVAIRNQIQKFAAPLNITVNPRYQPLEIGMLGLQSGGQIVVVPLGDQDERTPVTDVS